MNEIINFSLPAEKLSCLVGNLFAELEPPCSEPDDQEALTLCGKAPSGREAMLFVYREHCLFVGDPEDLDAARNGRCPNSRRCGRG